MPQEPTPLNQNRLQFGIGRLLVLTFVCAGVAALANALGGPHFWRSGIAILLILAAGYLVLRTPYLYQQLRIWGRDRQRLREKRAALNAMALERKREIQKAKDAADRPSPPHL